MSERRSRDRGQVCSRLITGCMVVIAAASGAVSAGEMEIVFRLVPRPAGGAVVDRHAEILSEGTVRLYRAGSYEVAHELAANIPYRVPEGTWAWIAEAPGYISTGSGALIVGARDARRELRWSVVEACRLELTGGDWDGIDRLDAVSLEHGSVYPLVARKRRAMNVPAGRFLFYTVSRGRIDALSEVMTCNPSDVVAVARPTPPPLDRHALVVGVGLAGAPSASAADVGFALRARTGDWTGQPFAVARSPGRATAFYLDLPLEPLHLAARHPARLSHLEMLTPVAGAIAERRVSLGPRVAIDIPVDYRPARAHRSAVLRLERCGDDRVQYLFQIGSCEEAAPPLALTAGASVYAFEGLDRGQYRVAASIDGEEVRGLEDGLIPYLEATPARLVAEPQTLVEHHIFGHLLEEEQPVAGEVRLVSLGSGDGPRFPTDDDMLYHLYYFGVRDLFDLHPVRRFEKEVGIPSMRMLEACNREDLCRRFHHRTAFRGSGRFDIALDDGATLRFAVTDAATGAPIEGAAVLRALQGGEPLLVFDRGQVTVSDRDENGRPMGEGMILHTDRGGHAHASGIAPGRHRWRVRMEGYSPVADWIELEDRGTYAVAVSLERLVSSGGLLLRLADGTPAAGAALLTFAADGTPDRACSAVANDLGEVTLDDACLADPDRPWLAFHPRATMLETNARALALAGDLALPTRVGPPLRIRLLDAAGTPAVDQRIVLRFDRFTLTPDHLLVAARSGLDVELRTDARGEIVYAFLSPSEPLPTVVVDGRSFPVRTEPGQAVAEVRLP